MRRAIKTAESLSPCVLWIDEIEKGFGSMSGGSGDSGTSSRVLAYFLTWLQEKTAPVFVIATANSIKDLPPELLRKGRFDEIFFIDLPKEKERLTIFDIHLRKRNRNPENFNIEQLARASDGFNGAEIEQAIIAALYETFPQDRDIETTDILEQIKQTVPLSVTMAEGVAQIRQWAAKRARMAS
jgi:SpoVK/Ycf46/Vps4 family AAA+-type ATPase